MFKNIQFKFSKFPVALSLLLMSKSLPLHAQQRSLGIDQAVEIALEKNRLLSVSGLEKDKSSVQLKEAKGLALPTISLTGNYLHYFQKQVSFLPGSFVGLGDNQIAPIRVGGSQAFVGSLNLNQPIFNPLINSGIRTAKINQTASAQDWQARKNNVVADVKKAYLDVLIAKEQGNLQKQSIVRNELALKDARSLMAQGRASRADTLRAFVSLQNLRPELYRLEQQVLINKILLKKILGVDEQESVELTDSLSVKDFEVIQAKVNPDDALLTRPEVLRAAVNEKYQSALVRRELAGRLPVLSLIGALQAQTQANNLDVSKYNVPMTSYLGLQLYVPVFNGFKNIYGYKRSQIALQQSKKQTEDVKAEVRTEAEISLSKLQEASVRIQAQKEVVTSAELGFKLTNDRYKQGISSRLELADAELSLSTAKSNYLQAIYDYRIAGIYLERAMGMN